MSATHLSIEAHALEKSYGADVRALSGLTFEVEAGTVFGLLGPNGAGKSTTVKILTTLSQADAGEARVAGFDVTRQATDVRRSIGVVAQRPGVDLEATGRENLVLQGQVFGLRGDALATRVDELLAHFHLTDAGGRIAGTYSGGMQRKLDVAMGLVHRPSVLFLDEPTTGLDPEARAEVWDEITRLSQQDGLTILLTTHYLEEADRLAGRLAIVDHGRVVVDGTPEELKGELRGDTITIELADLGDESRARTVLGRVDGLRDVVIDQRLVRARVDAGARAVPLLLTAFEHEGVAVTSVAVARPSLDDVYLRHVGHSITTAPSTPTLEGASR